MEIFQKICLMLTIIGGINWGLIGIADFNLVETLFSPLANIIYIIVGVTSLINIGILFNHLD